MNRLQSSLVCSGCGASPRPEDPYPFRCPRAGEGDVDHVLVRVLDSTLVTWPRETEPNPFLGYRALLHSYHLARAGGLGDEEYRRLVDQLDDSVAEVDGHGLTEPSAFAYVERHDNIEAIYKKLQERRDTADVTEVLKELHKIVNEAIRAQAPGGDDSEGLKTDLSQIDFAKLRDEFASKVKRKRAALQNIRDVVEKKLAQMLAWNSMRMDYYKKYQEIIADYNREKDRVTVEDTFAKLIELANSLDAEQRRAAKEGLSESELALFDLLFREDLSKADRERLKQASKALLASLHELLLPMRDWIQNTATQAEVKVFILDTLFRALPRPPFTDEETEEVAGRVYDYVWQRSGSGDDLLAA